MLCFIHTQKVCDQQPQYIWDWETLLAGRYKLQSEVLLSFWNGQGRGMKWEWTIFWNAQEFTCCLNDTAPLPCWDNSGNVPMMSPLVLVSGFLSPGKIRLVLSERCTCKWNWVLLPGCSKPLPVCPPDQPRSFPQVPQSRGWGFLSQQFSHHKKFLLDRGFSSGGGTFVWHSWFPKCALWCLFPSRNFHVKVWGPKSFLWGYILAHHL